MTTHPPETGHELDLWLSKQGELLGAPVLLTPAEARELQETGRVTIRRGPPVQMDDSGRA